MEEIWQNVSAGTFIAVLYVPAMLGTVAAIALPMLVSGLIAGFQELAHRLGASYGSR